MRKHRRFFLHAIAGAAGAFGVATLAGTEACTLTTNDALADAAAFDPDATQRVSVCSACSVQQCTGQWALCLQSAECFSIYACAKTGSPQECLCTGGRPADADGGRSSRAQTAYRALASCSEISACGACNAQCKEVAARLACGEAGAPLSLSVCTTDAGADAGAGGSLDGATDADLDAGDAGGGASDAADDGGDGGAPVADAGADAAPSVDAEAGPPVLGDCTGCIAGRCGDAKKACGIGSSCDVYVQCVSACADVACFERCGTIHASGKAALASLASCAAANCSTECGL